MQAVLYFARSCSRVVVVAAILSVIYVMAATPSARAIIGGEEAEAGAQPWMAAIALAAENEGIKAQICGGTLIDQEWILTAAHCTFDEHGRAFMAQELDVIISRHRLSSAEGERIAILRIVRHPDFDFSTFEADIALLQLAAPSLHDTISLAAPDAAGRNATATVFGWGVSGDDYPTDQLKQLALPIVKHSVCSRMYRPYGYPIYESMLCAGFEMGGEDACAGDSGGPLATRHPQSGRWIQIGIVSWGEGCAEPNLYGVYTDVASFAGWIEQVMRIW